MKKLFSRSRFLSSKTYLFILGLAATLWFLIRVIPKPSRARYPCMQVAAPIMSSFIIYLLGISASWFSFKKFMKSINRSRYLTGSLFLLLSIAVFGLIFLHDNKETIANALIPLDNTFPVESNQPIGEAKGLFPGRVVWVHDENATNEDFVPENGYTNFWFDSNNVDEDVIYDMLADAIILYAGAEEDDLAGAWDSIFHSFNRTHGRGDVGYTDGERIAFKINLTNQSAPAIQRPRRMDNTPQLLNAILDQLINVVGVAEFDITMGDPYREFRQEYKDLVITRFPGVYYVDGAGGDYVDQTVPSEEAVLKFSDKKYESTLPQHYLDATYLINMPCLKTHDLGGITLIAKNHQGSFLEKGDDPKDQYADDMHYSLPGQRQGTKQYRHTVDYMGHEQTGGKGLIYIIDAIWAGEGWEGYIKKFKSAPFNNDYPSSIFVGQDPVALESVGFDVLFHEYVIDAFKSPYPIQLKAEIADYLKQCASSDYWPSGIEYDPEGDGTPIGSLGVFEHWNNPQDRQYTRNLGTGDGIELVYYNPNDTVSTSTALPVQSIQIAAPNPFTVSTEFRRPENISRNSTLEIYSLKGELVQEFSFVDSDVITWSGTDAAHHDLPGGIYMYMIHDHTLRTKYSGKVILR